MESIQMHLFACRPNYKIFNIQMNFQIAGLASKNALPPPPVFGFGAE